MAADLEKTRIEQEDPLDGGGRFFRVAAFLLAGAALGGWWSSRQPLEALHDSLIPPGSVFAGMLGAFCLAFGTWKELRFRKFGHSVLEAEAPVAGRAWEGAVRTQRDLAVTGDFTVVLRCEESRYSPTEQSTVPFTVWKAACIVERAGVRSGQGIPFSFDPPGDAVPASSPDGRWWLEVSAPTRGVSYATFFDVTPLFARPPRGRPWWGEALEALTGA